MPDQHYTPDALRALTDYDLRVVIAERLGYVWMRRRHLRFSNPILRIPSPMLMEFNRVCPRPARRTANDLCEVPHWPTDIAAVWELVDHLEPTHALRLNARPNAKYMRRWYAAFEPIGSTRNSDGRIAPTITRAISEAYVLATNPTEGV